MKKSICSILGVLKNRSRGLLLEKIQYFSKSVHFLVKSGCMSFIPTGEAFIPTSETIIPTFPSMRLLYPPLFLGVRLLYPLGFLRVRLLYPLFAGGKRMHLLSAFKIPGSNPCQFIFLPIFFLQKSYITFYSKKYVKMPNILCYAKNSLHEPSIY